LRPPVSYRGLSPHNNHAHAGRTHAFDRRPHSPDCGVVSRAFGPGQRYRSPPCQSLIRWRSSVVSQQLLLADRTGLGFRPLGNDVRDNLTCRGAMGVVPSRRRFMRHFGAPSPRSVCKVGLRVSGVYVGRHRKSTPTSRSIGSCGGSVPGSPPRGSSASRTTSIAA